MFCNLFTNIFTSLDFIRFDDCLLMHFIEKYCQHISATYTVHCVYVHNLVTQMVIDNVLSIFKHIQLHGERERDKERKRLFFIINNRSQTNYIYEHSISIIILSFEFDAAKTKIHFQMHAPCIHEMAWVCLPAQKLEYSIREEKKNKWNVLVNDAKNFQCQSIKMNERFSWLLREKRDFVIIEIKRKQLNLNDGRAHKN